jgi:hypothetical protein
MRNNMNADFTSKVGSFRELPLVRRIGIAVLGAMIVAYLATISFSFAGRLQSTRIVVILVLSWGLGIVALTLLVRGYRSFSARKRDQK